MNGRVLIIDDEATIRKAFSHLLVADLLSSVEAEGGAAGTLGLSASHDEGAVLIRLEDDGRGLNREKIISKAREKGLLNGDGSELSDKEVATMIFQPGFSTADQVTDVSGPFHPGVLPTDPGGHRVEVA